MRSDGSAAIRSDDQFCQFQRINIASQSFIFRRCRKEWVAIERQAIGRVHKVDRKPIRGRVVISLGIDYIVHLGLKVYLSSVFCLMKFAAPEVLPCFQDNRAWSKRAINQKRTGMGYHCDRIRSRCQLVVQCCTTRVQFEAD
jgi:hypothetical protein